MKNTFLIIVVSMILFGCSSDKDKLPSENISSIKLIIDPNQKENKYEERIILDKDSILNLINCLNNKKTEPWKFVTRYTLEIKYSDKNYVFRGNHDHVMDENGRTYKLLTENCYLFNF